MLRKLTGPGLFRFFLAMVVFVHHTTRLAFGTCAVYIFFCLSGFWIYKMYTGRYAATRQPYLTYFISRLWRLLPTFWLISLITLPYLYSSGRLQASYRANSPFHFLISSLFFYGYDKLVNQPLVPAWSLDIEMQFYVIAPLLAILLAKRIVRWQWVLLSAAVISGVYAALDGYFRILSSLIFFVIGMIASSNDWRPSRKLATWTAAVALLLIAACLISPWRGILLVGAHRDPLAVFGEDANALIAILAVPFAIYTTRQKGFAFDDMLGDLSYVVYLLHWSAMTWVPSLASVGMAERLWVTGVGYCTVIGLSVVIWKYYDKPINRMRARWVKTRLKATVSAEARPVA
jgi:peptidoglycan/LPS O-acetylase OafA/YrhL